MGAPRPDPLLTHPLHHCHADDILWSLNQEAAEGGRALRKSRLGKRVSWGDFTEPQEALLTGREAQEERQA